MEFTLIPGSPTTPFTGSLRPLAATPGIRPARSGMSPCGISCKLPATSSSPPTRPLLSPVTCSARTASNSRLCGTAGRRSGSRWVAAGPMKTRAASRGCSRRWASARCCCEIDSGTQRRLYRHPLPGDPRFAGPAPGGTRGAGIAGGLRRLFPAAGENRSAGPRRGPLHLPPDYRSRRPQPYLRGGGRVHAGGAPAADRPFEPARQALARIKNLNHKGTKGTQETQRKFRNA